MRRMSLESKLTEAGFFCHTDLHVHLPDMALQMSTSASTCSLEPLVHSIEFKSGAVYTGTLGCGKKSGNGTFRWPSGVQYTGEYLEDRRHGYGVQVWAEGSKYEGEFRDDLRHGEGRHTWMSGEVRFHRPQMFHRLQMCIGLSPDLPDLQFLIACSSLGTRLPTTCNEILVF